MSWLAASSTIDSTVGIDDFRVHGNAGMLGRERFFLLAESAASTIVCTISAWHQKLFASTRIHDREKHQTCARALGTRNRPIQCATTALATSTPTRMLAIGASVSLPVSGTSES